MLLLLLLPLLFKGILCPVPSPEAGHVLEPHHLAGEEPLSFHMIQISSFANHSWANTQSSGWLGEVQTHRWDSVLGTIVYQLPWSQGNFSKEELESIQVLLQLYFHRFPQEVQAYSSRFQFEYPFVIQISSGCTIHPGKAPETFLNGAYQGSDFLSFQGYSWKPSPGAGSRAQNVCKLLNRYRIIKEIVKNLLGNTCPRFLAGIAAAGKSELERQVKPEAWVSKGTSPGPGRLLLVCHVSGFHPKPVWVRWMRGEKVQPGTQQGEVLPNADRTWYLRVTLDVAAREATGLTCRVKHSSLGGHDLIIHWDGYPVLLILICSAIMVTLVMLVVVGPWFQTQSSNWNICSPQAPSLAFPTGANIQEPRSLGNQLYLAQKSWMKNRFLKKVKINLSKF
ncbi:PREDICTED: T-cell surface glycoprotein CD1e, membrane-associated [Myotis davidii]|uniref:T-cell surface glycoprotein CD1e, membrane-associated n=1 Tax=Myotis davidii TaxID=225400 RepID=L5MHT1_MYODS|nr:PREDICTED: T-cell surface glycoprotein CD1e, membrane-associated [Myotis davidii]ELK37931.1 T-cell surface glycoprotein CD1e, membrane-associated [Myotis davidii]